MIKKIAEELKSKAGDEKLIPIGSAGSIRYKVDAELALGSFDGGVGGSGRNGEALGVQLEVVDESLHRGLKQKSQK